MTNSHTTPTHTKTDASLGDKLQDKGDELVDAAAEKTHAGIAKVADLVDSLATHAEDYKHDIVAFTKEKPLQALLIAALGGLILGKLLKK
jgi:ElaB/YqjD/DUF883 family membrane-anchored ribosome-binding protein